MRIISWLDGSAMRVRSPRGRGATGGPATPPNLPRRPAVLRPPADADRRQGPQRERSRGQLVPQRRCGRPCHEASAWSAHWRSTSQRRRLMFTSGGSRSSQPTAQMIQHAPPLIDRHTKAEGSQRHRGIAGPARTRLVSWTSRPCPTRVCFPSATGWQRSETSETSRASPRRPVAGDGTARRWFRP